MINDYQAPVAPKKSHKVRWIVLGAVLAVLAIIGIANGAQKPAAVTPPAATYSAPVFVPAPVVAPAPAVVAPVPSVAEPITTVSQRNAVRSAESYVSIMAFSKTGLIKQLKYEGFTAADAAYAADNIVVNWTEQADKSARSYLDTMPFSRSGLIKQLQYEGFSASDAAHGATSVGLK